MRSLRRAADSELLQSLPDLGGARALEVWAAGGALAGSVLLGLPGGACGLMVQWLDAACLACGSNHYALCLIFGGRLP